MSVFRTLVVSFAIALTACTGTTPDDDGGSSDPTDASTPDQPFVTVPSTITVPEGRTARVPVESHDDFAFTIAGDGLSATREGDDVVITSALGASSDGTLRVETLDGEATGETAITASSLAFTRIAWTNDGPSTREHGALVVSDDGGTIYVIGGSGYPNNANAPLYNDGWKLDLATETWTSWALTGDPLPPAGSMRVAHPPGDIAYLYGGYGPGFDSLGGLYAVTLSTGVVDEIAQVDAPPLRSLHAFAFDAETRTFVTFGGFLQTPAQQTVLGDTWLGELNGQGTSVRWEQLDGPSPPARYGMYFGFDANARRLIVYSGGGTPSPSNPVNAHDDVWTFDFDPAPTWFQQFPLGPDPIGRRNGCGIVDPETHALFIFGGTGDGATGTPGFFALHVDDDDALFVDMARDGAPPLRSSGFGAPLPGGGFICGFGNDDLAYQDLFLFR